jgi:hypothetical protein
MEKISYKSYIQMRFKLGMSDKKVYSELKTIDEDAATIQTVHYWFHLFKKGEKNLKDPEGKLRRPLMTIYLKFGHLSRVICTVLYDEIEAEFQISRGTIHNIIHDCLKLKKISSRFDTL